MLTHDFLRRKELRTEFHFFHSDNVDIPPEKMIVVTWEICDKGLECDGGEHAEGAS